jgi:hypothetical protein
MNHLPGHDPEFEGGRAEPEYTKPSEILELPLDGRSTNGYIQQDIDRSLLKVWIGLARGQGKTCCGGARQSIRHTQFRGRTPHETLRTTAGLSGVLHTQHESATTPGTKRLFTNARDRSAGSGPRLPRWANRQFAHILSNTLAAGNETGSPRAIAFRASTSANLPYTMEFLSGETLPAVRVNENFEYGVYDYNESESERPEVQLIKDCMVRLGFLDTAAGDGSQKEKRSVRAQTRSFNSGASSAAQGSSSAKRENAAGKTAVSAVRALRVVGSDYEWLDQF